MFAVDQHRHLEVSSLEAVFLRMSSETVTLKARMGSFASAGSSLREFPASLRMTTNEETSRQQMTRMRLHNQPNFFIRYELQ